MIYLSHPACLEHDPRAHMPAHPNTPERLRAIETALAERDWLRVARRDPPAASEDALRLIHSEGQAISAAPEALFTSRAAARVAPYWKL